MLEGEKGEEGGEMEFVGRVDEGEGFRVAVFQSTYVLDSKVIHGWRWWRMKKIGPHTPSCTPTANPTSHPPFSPCPKTPLSTRHARPQHPDTRASDNLPPSGHDISRTQAACACERYVTSVRPGPPRISSVGSRAGV